jgi:hypothetical protein
MRSRGVVIGGARYGAMRFACGPMMRTAPRLLLPALAAALVLAAAPGASAAAGYTCEASAVRATVLTGPAIEPATANSGAGDCRAATGSLAAPAALPLPLSLGALDATTALDGAGGPVQGQTAHASAGVADLRVQALPGLPIDLPLPDLSQFAHVQVPGGPEIDLRPAIQALIAPRQLAGIDLLDVQAARSQAEATCAGGAPKLSGGFTLAGVSIAGQAVDLNGPLTRTVKLIDSQSIDPSDLSQIQIPGLPPGVSLAVLQPVLDALPTITVPATLARVRLVPGERAGNGVRLTERALHAQISIAGQNLADAVLGESTVGSDGVSCGGVADLALQCTARRIVLIDVLIRHGRVHLAGAADRRFAGRRVRIRSAWDGHTVARPRLSRTGLFSATAKLPPRSIRTTNDARYQAAAAGQRSLDLKLVRRMLVTRMVLRGGTVRIAGRVTRPLAAPRRPIAVKQRVSCQRWKVVKRFQPRADGHFDVRLDAPAEGEAAAYRMQTRVRKFTYRPNLYPTFTLPRYIDLGRL